MPVGRHLSFLTWPVFSIEGVIWTAVGGRGTLIGPFIGAFLVKGAEFFLSGALASWWQIIVGGLFIFVVLVMRDGIVGTIGDVSRKSRKGATYEEVMEDLDQRPTTARSIGSLVAAAGR